MFRLVWLLQAPEAPDTSGRYGIITGITVAVIVGVFFGYKLITSVAENRRQLREYNESKVQSRISAAVADANAKLTKATEKEIDLQGQLAACREERERIERKADEVTKKDAQVIGQVEDLLRSINSVINRRCPHCGEKLLPDANVFRVGGE